MQKTLTLENRNYDATLLFFPVKAECSNFVKYPLDTFFNRLVLIFGFYL